MPAGWSRPSCRLVVLGVVGVVLGLAPAAQAAGELDSSFGSGGVVTTSPGSFPGLADVAIQPDGKIVSVGTAGSDFAVVRHLPGGALDATFGTGGQVLTDFGGFEGAASVALQPDGKIVVAGNAGGDFALARYHADGSLDGTFGVGGKVLSDFAGSFDAAQGVAVQADGSIVAAGLAFVGFTTDFALARYNPDGTPDAGFGSGGQILTDFGGAEGENGDSASDVAIGSDGKIVAAGNAHDNGSSGGSGGFGLARYETDGSLDASFGSGGLAVTDFAPGRDSAFSVLLQPDGKVVAVGLAPECTSPCDVALARYSSDGSLDGTFGTGGKVQSDFGGYEIGNDAALQPDGKIVVAGNAGGSLGSSRDHFLARYNPDGSLDTGFGIGGEVRHDFGGTDYATAVALQPDGKVVVGGRVDGSSFTLLRYLSGPAPDPDADGDGILDSVDPDPGLASNSFADGAGSSGSISDRAGLEVTVEDAPDPEGLRVTVAAGTGHVTLQVCGAFTLHVAAGSEIVVTCGSVSVQVIEGSADVVLGGGLTVVSINAGVTAKVTQNPDGSFSVQNLGGGNVTVTVDGVTTTIGSGQSKSVTALDFQGFAAPVDNRPVLNVVKAGQAVPFKWRLLRPDGSPYTGLTAASITAGSLTCALGSTPDLLEEVAPGDSGLINLGNGYYQLGWKTPKSYADSCKVVRLNLGEGVTRDAYFKFAK